MKTSIQNSAARLSLMIPLLLVALVWIGGCATRTPDPLAGWKVLLSHDSDRLSRAIKDDYRGYIQKQFSSKKYFIDENDIWFYEDKIGQHAVRIDIPVRGTYWEYVLIYDKDNKRTKVIKYIGGRYGSYEGVVKGSVLTFYI